MLHGKMIRGTNAWKLILAFALGYMTAYVFIEESAAPVVRINSDMRIQPCDNCIPLPETGCSLYLLNLMPGHRHGVVIEQQEMLKKNFTPLEIQFTLSGEGSEMVYSATMPFDMFHVVITAKPDSCNRKFGLKLFDKRSGTREMPHVWSFPAAQHQMWLMWSSKPLSIDEEEDRSTFDQEIPVTLIREQLPSLPSSDDRDDLPACYFEQECGLLLSPNDPCGVQPIPNSPTWLSWREQMKELPYCKYGDAAGRWVLPCSSCRQDSLCMWEEAVWQPYDCRYLKLTIQELQQCLAGVKLLYVGDSTMRGMYFRLLQRLNGTLINWTKVRSLRTDLGVNRGLTDFTYNYYYRVGGGAGQKLKLHDHFMNQLERMKDLKNDSSTVFIMGGQTWLNDLDMTMMKERLLPKYGLEGARVVAKTLNTGMPYLPNGNVCKLMDKNRHLTDSAKKNNILLVDTFNMTASRYLEFYGGGCVCHFQYAHPTGKFYDGGEIYLMEGPVNNAHEEILEHVLCNTG